MEVRKCLVTKSREKKAEGINRSSQVERSASEGTGKVDMGRGGGGGGGGGLMERERERECVCITAPDGRSGRAV